MSFETLTPTPIERAVRKRTRRDPKPRYREDISNQMDAILGCPAVALPADHIARVLKPLVSRLDLKRFDEGFSSLGRHGYDPRHVLGAWVLASIMGLHHATVVARRLKTDVALRFMSGGHALSAGVLKRFRARASDFAELIQQTVQLAVEKKLVDPEALAVDSVRLRAHASTAAVRTVSRSEERLIELAKVDVATLSDAERLRHDGKVQKHSQALELCASRNVTNVVVTNAAAALMKFPSGAAAPGQRVTIAASGVQERFIIAALIDSRGNDFGHLEEMLTRARKALEQAGLPVGVRMQAAADAGYFCERDLLFAQSVRQTTDVLIPEPPSHGERGRAKGLFGREKFKFEKDGTVRCPAGTLMLGPKKDRLGEVRWEGQGCATCALKTSCTRGKQRKLIVNPRFDAARMEMRQRMSEPNAAERYGKRIATVEPVFSILEDRMQYRRVSTRHEKNSVAEILLKLLAYNLVRLAKATHKLSRAHFAVAIHSWTGAFLLEPCQPN
jgi:transposase